MTSVDNARPRFGKTVERCRIHPVWVPTTPLRTLLRTNDAPFHNGAPTSFVRSRVLR